MDIHKAQKLITALNRIGYNGEINPDNIDQLFLSWSSLIVLENLTEWLLHDCPSRADLERYEHIKSMGYHVIPDENEDNSDILKDIAKQESLISFYEKELPSKQEEIEALQCEAETSDRVIGDKSRWNCFKRLQKGIKNIDPFCEEHDEPPFVQNVFSELTDTFEKLVSEIDEILSFIDSFVDPDNSALPGAEFDIIHEAQLLIKRQRPELDYTFKNAVKSYRDGDGSLLNGQDWIDINRDQLHLRIKTLSCRLLIEALALIQIFSTCLDTFEERFADNVSGIQKLISRMESVKDSLRVEVLKDAPIPSIRTPELVPVSSSQTLLSKRAEDDLRELETMMNHYISTGTFAPERITNFHRDLDELLKSVSAQIQAAMSDPPKLTIAQLDMKDLLTSLNMDE